MPLDVVTPEIRRYLLGDLDEAGAAALEDRYVADPALLERVRAAEDALDEEWIGPAPPIDHDPEPHLHECLERCLAALPADARTLILEYYQDQRRQKIDRRVRLAAQLGLSANALRSRAQRVRDRLERCVRTCAASPSGDTNPGPAHFPRDGAAGDRLREPLPRTDDAP